MQHVKAYLQDFAASVALLVFIGGIYVLASGLAEHIVAGRIAP